MSKLIASPVELGFSEFVSKLIADTFDAVIVSAINQEENWSNLERLLSLDFAEFMQEVIEDEMVTQELANLFPDVQEGKTQITQGAAYTKEDIGKNQAENPPIFRTLGYQPEGKELSEKDVDSIRQIVKKRLGEKQFILLSKVFSMGSTKVMVDAGKINAKLNFQIMQMDETDEDGEPPQTNLSQLALNKKLFLTNSFPSMSKIQRPAALNKVRLFVKPPSDKDPQSHQITANVYGEVEIHFKTIS